MTSMTFFFYLIPILAIVLLAVNFLLATHNPYQEKNSPFECGFHSFLGQNRMQFNISFYIFGLLFLLFDLEILLIYPYPVSSYFNNIYGLCIMLIFFIILTIGFAFELGKNALKIDSRQYNDNNVIYESKKTTILEANLLGNKKIIYLIFIVIAYISVRYCISIPIFCTGPEEDYIEEAVDENYIKDQIFSIQNSIKAHGLTGKYLTSQQIEDKREAMQALKENFEILKEMKQTDSSTELMENIKRTADSLENTNNDTEKLDQNQPLTKSQKK